MSFFQQTQQTQIVRIDAENTVTIRKLTFGESQEVLSESLAIDVAERDAQFDFARNQSAKLVRAVVAWDGPGFEGRPVTRENILALPVEVGQAIVKAVEELNAGLSEPEQKN